MQGDVDDAFRSYVPTHASKTQGCQVHNVQPIIKARKSQSADQLNMNMIAVSSALRLFNELQLWN